MEQSQEAAFKKEFLGEGDLLGETDTGTKTSKYQSTKDKKDYAIKMVQIMDSKDVEWVELILKEVKLLEHPNLVKIYDHYKYTTSDSISSVTTICVKMELGAISLEKEIAQRKQNSKYYTDIEILFYIRYCLEALEYLSARNLSHLNLKPDNILISQLGIVKLADYGFAKRDQGKKEHGATATVQVTIANPYSAPEIQKEMQRQKAAQEKAAQEGRVAEQMDCQLNASKCDVYSLGMSCIRMGNLAGVSEIRNINTDVKGDKKVLGLLKAFNSKSSYMTSIFKDMLQSDPENRHDIGKLKVALLKGTLKLI